MTKITASTMAKSQLIEMAKEGLAQAQQASVAQAGAIFKVPDSNHYDQGHWELEIERIFKRMPMMLATSAELPQPGDYKAIEAAGDLTQVYSPQDFGARDHILFGRNGLGGQKFHQWAKKILVTDDQDLNALFNTPQHFQTIECPDGTAA